MIPKAELLIAAKKFSLPPLTVEKDYILGWMLCALYTHSDVQGKWIFKGGTSLKKCYFEDYRFSEDLDFTILNPITIRELQDIIRDVALWLWDNIGIEIDQERTWFETLASHPNQQITQGAVYYRGPASPSHKQGWPRIKFDITFDEVLVDIPEIKSIIHLYSDKSQRMQNCVSVYSIVEIFIEKMRAIKERTSPRDLYDIVQIWDRMDITNKVDIIQDGVAKKMAFKNLDLNWSDISFTVCKASWKSLLGHQMNSLESFDEYLPQFLDILPHLKRGGFLT